MNLCYKTWHLVAVEGVCNTSVNVDVSHIDHDLEQWYQDADDHMK